MAQTLIDDGLDIVSGGTDNHLMMVDLRDHGITGKEASARHGQYRHHRQQEYRSR